ncbi:GntR family transcriptional regulator [Marinomonas sp. C2222]|uniref:GntR family transcriptional regulator n=1 Tax=Marinomonas sargassi TaxID=2984494 RepID=A0ABT2YQ85_9GAMM|nr:GntR family transcriptional regulator [Marinomonas sargassi]MCV2402052.1 GntR family transcriptional regulator [Marinomonas sargassi]
MADFLYKGVVDWFLDQMSQEKIVPGEKMPSLRALSKELSLSLNTVIHGYELLSKDGWIESRPKSGYFVCHRSERKPALLLAGEELSRLKADEIKPAWSCLSHRGALVDQSDNFVSSLSGQETGALPVLGKGNLESRETVCNYLNRLGIKSHASHLWLGHSPLTFFTQTVQSLTLPGNTVLVLSPCDPRITTTIQSLGRKVISISAGERGVDLDLVIRCLRDEEIHLLVLPSQFAFPTGQLISNLSLRRWLAIIDEMKLPTIEWDLCSHLAYHPSATLTYKSLDQSDHIVYIGGVESKGAGLSYSWCLPGRHGALLEGAFLGADMALNDAQQVTLNDILKPSSKRSLTKRARNIWANSEKLKASLESSLGERVSFASSKGGLSLWLYLDTPIDMSNMTSLLVGYRHAIVPGELISHEKDANHWLAVNLSLDDIEPLAAALVDALMIEETPSEIDEGTTSDSESESGDEESLINPEELIAEEIIEEDIASDSLVEDKAQTDSKEETIQQTSEAKSEESESKSKDAAAEPVYNPMLDLINHDFG